MGFSPLAHRGIDVVLLDVILVHINVMVFGLGSYFPPTFFSLCFALYNAYHAPWKQMETDTNYSIKMADLISL